MALGITQTIPAADFSAAGLGRIPAFTAAEIALSQVSSLKSWLDPDVYWAPSGSPLDRVTLTPWVPVGTVSRGTGINSKPTWSFDGTAGKYVNSPGDVYPATGDWTLSVVAKPNASGTVMLLVGSQGGAYFGFQRPANNNASVSTSTGSVFSYNIPWTTQAVHLELCFQSAVSKFKVMVNGSIVGSQTSLPTQTKFDLQVGTLSGSSSAWNGHVGDVQIFNVDLSDAANAAVQTKLRTFVTGRYGI